jgi:hypothetical protein
MADEAKVEHPVYAAMRSARPSPQQLVSKISMRLFPRCQMCADHVRFVPSGSASTEPGTSKCRLTCAHQRCASSPLIQTTGRPTVSSSPTGASRPTKPAACLAVAQRVCLVVHLWPSASQRTPSITTLRRSASATHVSMTRSSKRTTDLPAMRLYQTLLPRRAVALDGSQPY